MPPDPSSPRARFEDHVGELELTLEADSLDVLFTEAARVVSRECGETEGPPGPWERVELAARDVATLFVDWLNELIGRSEVETRAYDEVRGLAIAGVSGRPGDTGGRSERESRASGGGTTGAETDRAPETTGEARLQAEVRGRPVSTWTSAIKAATYHGLELERRDGRWKARVLFDV